MDEQEQRSAAVGVDAVHGGIIKTNSEFYDRFSLETAGIGASAEARHDVLTCTDLTCAHPDHGNSTAGANLPLVCPVDGNRWQPDPMRKETWACPTCGARGSAERAGEVYDGQGRHSVDARDDRANDPRIAGGNLVEIADAIEAHANGEACLSPTCRRCNEVSGRTLQRPSRVEGGGGGSRGPKGKAGTKVCNVVGCGLTLCEHVRGASSGKKRGPKPKSTSRRKTVAFKVTADAKTGLKLGGADGKIVNKLGIAMQRGLKYEDVDAFIASRTQQSAA